MDFGSISGRGSMRRKQSNSILGAFNKPSASRTSAITSNSSSQASQSSSASYYAQVQTPPTSASSHLPDRQSFEFSPEVSETASTRTMSYSAGANGTVGSRSVSGSTIGPQPMSAGVGQGGMSNPANNPGVSAGGTTGGEKKVVIRKPEDVFRVTRDRLFSWSYMMQWYQGEIHWFNTVKVSRSALENTLGPSKVDTRARNLYILGTSLGPLFDITSSADYLKAVMRLLDEWETYVEGKGPGVKTLFRGQKARKSVTPGMINDTSSGIVEGDSLMLNLHVPFCPDFFQCHAIFCSMIRDVYKKFLNMVLPTDPRLNPQERFSVPPAPRSSSDPNSLFHPSTIIQSAPIDSGSNPLSPVSTTHSQHSDGPHGQSSTNALSSKDDPLALGPNPKFQTTQQDAFQALLTGELGGDHMLIGDGQKLTVPLVEMFVKVDARLKKLFSGLIREGDALARKVLDEELAALTASLAGGPPIKFDYNKALSGHGQSIAGYD